MTDRIPLAQHTKASLDALYAEVDRLTAELGDYDQRVERLTRTLATPAPAATEATEPATITDPAYLRNLYAEAIAADDGHPWNTLDADAQQHYRDNADAVLNVHDRHLQQLRQRLALADTELQQWAAAESADAAAGSYAGRAEEAEATIARVTALYDQWVKAGPPPLGTLMARWWDARLVELHNAIRPAAEQPARTTPNNPPTGTDTADNSTKES